MPLQKNSGNKKAKKESGVATKNKRFVTNILDDLRTEGKVDGVHIARVTKKLGNGRVEVFYVKKNGDTDDTTSFTACASIPGRFRGKGKHSVWIEVSSPVAISDTGIGIIEVVAVLTRDNLKDISKEMFVDHRILNFESAQPQEQDGGFEFEDGDEIEAEEPVSKKLIHKEELLDEDIDDI